MQITKPAGGGLRALGGLHRNLSLNRIFCKTDSYICSIKPEMKKLIGRIDSILIIYRFPVSSPQAAVLSFTAPIRRSRIIAD
jgi:hypothetical protein